MAALDERHRLLRQARSSAEFALRQPQPRTQSPTDPALNDVVHDVHDRERRGSAS
jgi:hypothetical protein